MNESTWTEPGYMDKPGLDRLVGRVVRAVFVNSDQSILALDVGDGVAAICADGDCCSETWFADIVGMDDLRGHAIVSAERIDVPDRFPQTNERTRQEEDEHYAIRLTTAAGTCVVVYRNSSNGYYGGESWVASNTRQTVPDGYDLITGDEWSA